MSKFEEKKLSSERIFEGRIISLKVDRVELPGGKVTTREVVEHPGAVAVVGLAPGERVVLVRQFRYPAGEEMLEIPAGGLHPGEDPGRAAARELEEETGLRAGKLTKLAEFFTTPGFTNEIMHLYLAEGLEGSKPNPDEDEFLEVEIWPLSDALEAVREGRIRDGKTIAGLLLAGGILGR
ncbi:MAG: NUDIX hydrolase [Actinobacteria bacterium]|nr:NUDIX hydrolase [Actinomycetota bacterium]